MDTRPGNLNGSWVVYWQYTAILGSSLGSPTAVQARTGFWPERNDKLYIRIFLACTISYFCVYYVLCVVFVFLCSFLQYFDTVGWVF